MKKTTKGRVLLRWLLTAVKISDPIVVMLAWRDKRHFLIKTLLCTRSQRLSCWKSGWLHWSREMTPAQPCVWVLASPIGFLEATRVVTARRAGSSLWQPRLMGCTSLEAPAKVNFLPMDIFFHAWKQHCICWENTWAITRNRVAPYSDTAAHECREKRDAFEMVTEMCCFFSFDVEMVRSPLLPKNVPHILIFLIS